MLKITVHEDQKTKGRTPSSSKGKSAGLGSKNWNGLGLLLHHCSVRKDCNSTYGV